MDELKKLHEAWACGDDGAKQALANYMLEHAQEIVAAVNALPELLAKVKRLEEALRGIVENCQTIRPEGDNVAWSYADPVNPMNVVSARRIDRARAALNQEPTHE